MKRLKRNAIVKYIGPSTGELEHGEDVRICNLRHSNSKELTWCSNMNMPLCGAFSGVIPRDMLEAY